MKIQSDSDKIGKTKVQSPTKSDQFLFHSRLIINSPVCYNDFAASSLLWPSLFINTCSVSSAKALSNNGPGHWNKMAENPGNHIAAAAIEVIAIYAKTLQPLW